MKDYQSLSHKIEPDAVLHLIDIAENNNFLSIFKTSY